MGTAQVKSTGIDSDKTNEEIDEEKAIQLLAAETDSELTVKIYRMKDDAPGGKIWLGDMPASGFTLQAVKGKYGGGEYLLNVLNSLGKFSARKKIAIYGEPKKEEVEKTVEMQRGTNENMPMFQMMMENMRADSIRQQESNTAMMTAMLARETPAPAQNSMAETIAMITAIQSMTPKTETAPGMGLKEVLELAEKFSNLGGSGGETNEMGVLLEALKTFGGPLADAIKHGQPPTATQPANVNRRALNAPEDEALKLKTAIDRLLQLKNLGLTPEQSAEMIKAQVPAPILNMIISKLKGDSWLQTITAACPDANAAGEWLGELRNILLGLTAVSEGDTLSNTGPTVTGLDNVTGSTVPL